MDRPIKRSLSVTPGSIGGKSPPLAVLGPIALLLTIALLILFVTISGAFWYLAYGIEKNPPEEIRLSAIGSPQEVYWHPDGAASIVADSVQHMLAILGYVHARNHPWHTMLWRQTAAGGLSDWFGPSLIEIDRLSRQLRFEELARITFERLPSADQQLLRAYAEGVNIALTEEHILIQDDFALLNVAPERWEPWHALAVERLFAWLSMDLSTLRADTTPLLRELLDSDTALRQWLQVHSLHNSVAAYWPSENHDDPPSFYYRIDYGSSALPIIQEVELIRPDRPPLFLAGIPGTFLFFSGQEKNARWALLPESRFSLSIVARDTLSTTSYERIDIRDGSEVLAQFDHRNGYISLQDSVASPPDSVRAFHWPGLRIGTDLPAMLSVLQGEQPSFTLQTGRGLTMRDTTWAFWYEPAYHAPLAKGAGIMIGSTPWVVHQAAHIDSMLVLDPASVAPENWENDCFSRWAENRMAHLSPLFLPIPRFERREYLEALTYLRNWDYTYEPSSIGATIFTYFERRLSRMSGPALPDSATVVFAFTGAVDVLTETYGADLSQWRFEVTHPAFRYYPAWTADSTFSAFATPLSSTRFAALSFAGKGHASTLCRGSIDAAGLPPATAYWETWNAYSNDQEGIFWKKNAVPEEFLDRYLIANRPNVRYRLNRGTPTNTRITRFLPRS